MDSFACLNEKLIYFLLKYPAKYRQQALFVSWETNFPTLIFINLALWTLFICALSTTEYFT